MDEGDEFEGFPAMPEEDCMEGVQSCKECPDTCG